MALKMTLIEGKGEFNYSRYQENLHIMLSLWEEIADLADFDKVRHKILFFYMTKRIDISLLAHLRSCIGFKFFEFFRRSKIVTREHSQSLLQTFLRSKTMLSISRDLLKFMYFVLILLQKSHQFDIWRFLGENTVFH